VGGVTAALAAGASVILKPAPQVLRIAEVFVEAMREAGVGEDLLQLVNADEDEAGKRLISHSDVESVILTGASETAQLFRSWAPRRSSRRRSPERTPSSSPRQRTRTWPWRIFTSPPSATLVRSAPRPP